ncbi:CUB domain-containing protein [Hymenobacter sp. B81]|uniref:CUB domain-containing protein n=1 Tax=Hymenobacter sp. B81 TaxID=3344878 RepID=UPI0037DD47B7
MKQLYCIGCLMILLIGTGRLHAQTYIMPTSGSAMVTACGGTITDPGGPSGNYGNNADGLQVLRPTTSARRVSLTFSQVQLETCCDFLRIYDGSSTSAPLLATISNMANTGIPYTATNAEGTLTLRFTSDNSISRAGWVAALSCVLLPGATAGNVGVGTSAPEEKLQVAGIVYSTQGGVRFPDGTLQPTAATDVQQLSITGSTISLTNGGSVTVPGDHLGNHTATQNVGLNGNWLSNNGGARGLRITNGGQVGIGTASPDRPLTVQGTGTNHELISLRTTAGTTRWHWNLAGDGLNLAETGVSDSRLYVEPGGQVGIGTSTPERTLDVNGTARVASDLTVTGNVGMGYTLVTANDNMAGNSRSVWTLPCPAGMRVLGGGGGHRDWNSAASDIVVNYSGPHPDAPETQWRVIVTNNSGSSRATRYYCICARMAP